jgi:hypothetical protein
MARIWRSAVLSTLLLAAGCREKFAGYTPSEVDPSLAGPIDPTQIDFESCDPTLVEQHEVYLLRRFGGQRNQLGPFEWNESTHWSAGELSNGSMGFRYVRAAPFVFCLGVMHGKLGWSSSAAPDETYWVEDELAPPRGYSAPRFDAARIGDTLVLVRDGQDGLLEIDFGVESGVLVERSRHLVSAVGEDPVLLEVGPDLLFFWWEPTMENGGPWGGRALRIVRWAEGSGGWSPLRSLTLTGTGHLALARRGNQVAIAWPDNRYQRIEGLGLGRQRKLFVATSLDRGASWSEPRCVLDPAAKTWLDEGMALLPFGERWLVVAPSGVFPKPEKWGDTLVLSPGLDRWLWLPGEHHDELAKAAVPRLTHD